MKNLIGLLTAYIIAGSLFAQDYKPTDQGSTIEFVIKNFGINTRGSFTGLDGHIHFDPADAAKAAFDVTIGAATINTDNNTRDGHLKKDTYFDVEKYPRIRIISTVVTADNSGKGHFTGKLTIKETTKDISFPFTAIKMGEDYIFKGSFTINRKDFGIGGASTIGNSCTVNLTVLAKKTSSD
jgi:polyisoprenoid-binding protein YceI